MINAKELLPQIKTDLLNQIDTDIKAIFSYGSTVYGNKNPDDLDLIVVTSDFEDQIEKDIDGISCQATFIPFDKFNSMLINHKINALECFKLKGDNLINEFDKDVQDAFDEFVFQSPSIRKSFSQISSNSYVKTKKKLIIPQDFDIETAKKSLFHSMRIVMFGITFCKTKQFDFQEANALYTEIEKDFDLFEKGQEETFWNMIHAKYKPMHNALLSEFRILAPKD